MDQMDLIETKLINPRLLMDLGFEFNISLIKSNFLIEALKSVPEIGVEAYQILGNYDIIFKHFQRRQTLQGLFSLNKVNWSNMREWRVKHVDRYYFQSNFEYTPWAETTDKTIRTLKQAQTDWNQLGNGAKKELLDNNYVLQNSMKLASIKAHKISHVFTFISLPKADQNDAIERNKRLRDFLLPRYANIICSLYWADEGDPSQCLIECQHNDIWEILDLVTFQLHQYFGEGSRTETYVCTQPVFDRVTVDLPDSWPTDAADKSNDGNTKFREYLLTIQDAYQKIENLIEKYGYGIEFNQKDVCPQDRVSTVIFFERCLISIQEIKQHGTSDCDILYSLTDRVLADMLYGVLLNDTSFIGQGAIRIGAMLELMFRRTLSSFAFMELKEAEKVKNVLKVESVKKKVFPDNLRAKEFEEKITLWNEQFPQRIFIPQQMLDDWKLFKPIRNMGGHALSSDLNQTKEYAPLGFSVLSKLVKIRSTLPEQHRYKFDQEGKI